MKSTGTIRSISGCMLLTFILIFAFFVTPVISAETLELPVVTWKMTTTCGPGTLMWDANMIVPRIVKELTGGRFEIKPFAPGALVPSFEAYDAVKSGSIECSQEWGCYWVGKNTAYGAINSICTGLNGWDLLNWYYQGGGEKLCQEIWAKDGFVWFADWGHGAEQGFLTNKPIRTLEDFKGLKLRVSGQVSRKVVEAVGASAVMLPGGEVFEAMKRGVIDGVEMATPYVNWQLGLQDTAKYWSTPVWHQRSGLHGLMVNQEAFDKLPEVYKAVLKYACQASTIEGMLLQDYKGAEGTKLFLEHGIEVVRMNDETIRGIELAAVKVKQQFAEENPDFAKILESQQAYLDNYAEWRNMQVPSIGSEPIHFEMPH